MPTGTSKKTTRKGSRTRVSARKVDQSDVSRELQELRELKDRLGVMPFEIVDYNRFFPDPGIERVNLSDYRWFRPEARVADAALAAGFNVAVQVPPCAVGHAAAGIAQAISRRVCMGYQSRTQTLYVWDHPDNEDEHD